MEGLFNLLKEAENIKQNIKFTKICEAYNAADLKKTDLNGYNANTQSFRQYIKEIMDLLAKLNQEMEKIYKINDTMFSRNANLINNYAELEKIKNTKVSNDLSVKYTNIELKLFLCIKVFYTIIDIYKGLSTDEKSQVSEEILATKDHLLKVIAAVKKEFKIQQGLIYAPNIESEISKSEYDKAIKKYKLARYITKYSNTSSNRSKYLK